MCTQNGNVEELKALTWSEIDLDKRLIEVQRSCRKSTVSNTNILKRCRVDMSLRLSEILQDMKLTQQKRALKIGPPFPELVFADGLGRLCVCSPFVNALKRRL